MEKIPSRRDMLKGIAGGAVAAGLGSRGAEAAPAKPESMDIEKQLETMQSEAEKLLLAIKRERELLAKKHSLADLGTTLTNLREVAERSAKIGELGEAFEK